MTMASISERAERFRALHRFRRLFVLPNAWDVASARLFEESGFPAVATSSAGICVSLGYRDGETIPWTGMLSAVRRIAEHLTVPLSVDLVGGFGRSSATLARHVREVVRAGAVGLNIEDEDPGGGRLVPLARQLERLRTIRRTAEELGVPLVLNARTDALYVGTGTPSERFDEAVRRALAFREAGADCVYPMRLVRRAEIARFLRLVPGPLNVMVRPGLPTLPVLERLGVRRVSFGPAASYAALGLLRRAGREILEDGSFRLLVQDALTFDELNRLADRRVGRA